MERGLSGEREKRPFELPARRISRCEGVELLGQKFFIHCGFHPDGSVREIFITARRESSDLLHMLSNTCIGLSYRMQFGARLAEMDVRGDFMDAVLKAARVIEAECAAEVMAEYARVQVAA